MSLPRGFRNTSLAHRALHDRATGAVENSPLAIRRAIAAGYGIEIDLQLSRDGVAMVFHDPELDRLTDQSGPVSGRDATELGRIRLSGTQDTIPTLAEVLDLVHGQVPVLLELKDQSGCLGPGPATLERAVARDLARYAGDVAVMSFNPNVVAALAAHAPDIPRGLVTSDFPPEKWPAVPEAERARLRRIADFETVGASFVSHYWADLGRPRIAELAARGVPILCWTTKTPDQHAEALKIAETVTFEGYLPPPRD